MLGQLHGWMWRCIDRTAWTGGGLATGEREWDSMRGTGSSRKTQGLSCSPTERYHFGRDRRDMGASNCRVLAKESSKKVVTFLFPSSYLYPSSKRIGLLYLLESYKIPVGFIQDDINYEQMQTQDDISCEKRQTNLILWKVKFILKTLKTSVRVLQTARKLQHSVSEKQ